jgi:hypothetical protein
MITQAVTQTVTFKLLTWEGSEEEIRDFAGDKFIRMADDGVALCQAPRDHVIRLRPGDFVLKPLDAELPLLWFFGDDPWVPVLFQRLQAN